MSQNHDFRPQTGVATPASGIFTYYVNASGALLYTGPNGSGYAVSAVYTATGFRTQVSSGTTVFSNGVAGGNFTGTVFGLTGVNPSQYPRLLGEPNFWFNVLGPNNEPVAIPGFLRVS